LFSDKIIFPEQPAHGDEIFKCDPAFSAMDDRIKIDERIIHGKPVIRGTRVPVEVILGSLASRMSYEEVEKEYDVRREDILAAISYAARIISEERVRSLKAGV
jgi:uncharacterized protein (DUF433 family)